MAAEAKCDGWGGTPSMASPVRNGGMGGLEGGVFLSTSLLKNIKNVFRQGLASVQKDCIPTQLQPTIMEIALLTDCIVF